MRTRPGSTRPSQTATSRRSRRTRSRSISRPRAPRSSAGRSSTTAPATTTRFDFGGLEAAATYLGLTGDELRERLESGDTLAEIAGAEGKTVDGLVQAMVDSAEEDIAAAVEAGRLTQEQGDEILADLPQRIEDMVNGELLGPGGPPGHRWGDGPERAESDATA